jgi:hypothetical protein
VDDNIECPGCGAVVLIVGQDEPPQVKTKRFRDGRYFITATTAAGGVSVHTCPFGPGDQRPDDERARA